MNSRTHTINHKNNNDDIIVAIVTDNLSKLKALLNTNNVNNVIDTKNNYTALHYAVTLPNNDITKFILDLGGDATNDICELALRSGKKYVFQYLEHKKQIKIDNLEINNSKLLLKINDLKKTNEIMFDTMDKFNDKINALHQVIEIKDKEIEKLKRNLCETEKAFENLLKKQRK